MTTADSSAGSAELRSTRLGDTGPLLVLLHGLFGQGKNWTTVAKALSARHRVLLVDLPNHGRSRWTRHFSYPDMAAAVADLVTSGGQRPDSADPVCLVGHSMGGKVAMVLALLRPQLVDRLVAVDISPVRYQRLSSFADFVAGMRALDLSSLADRVSADRDLATYVPDPTVRSFLLQNLRRETGEPSGWRWQMNLELLGDHLAELADWPDLDAAPYTGPVLWLAGARSDYVRPEYAPQMRALFPRAQLVTVKNSGHWVHAEQPDVFAAAVERFVHPPRPA